MQYNPMSHGSCAVLSVISCSKVSVQQQQEQGGWKTQPVPRSLPPSEPQNLASNGHHSDDGGGRTAVIIYPFVLSPFYRTGGFVRPAVLPIEPTSPPFSSKFSRSNQQLLTLKVRIYLPLLVALLKATLNRRSYTTAPQLAFCFSFVCNKQAPPCRNS